MKQNIDMKFRCIYLMITFLISGCDWSNQILIIKNDSKTAIYYTDQLGKFTSDSVINIYYTHLKENVIKPNAFRTIHLTDRVLNKEPDSVKMYLYIFNTDSLDKYQKVSSAKGIFIHSLIRKSEIQLNKVKEPLDTIYIK